MTNETKQTSVDQLFDQLSSENLLGLFTHDQMKRAMEILDEAKSMHKEEIVDANFYGQRLHSKSVTNTMMEDNAFDYYNETFGGNNEQQ